MGQYEVYYASNIGRIQVSPRGKFQVCVDFDEGAYIWRETSKFKKAEEWANKAREKMAKRDAKVARAQAALAQSHADRRKR